MYMNISISNFIRCPNIDNWGPTCGCLETKWALNWSNNAIIGQIPNFSLQEETTRASARDNGRYFNRTIPTFTISLVTKWTYMDVHFIEFIWENDHITVLIKFIILYNLSIIQLPEYQKMYSTVGHATMDKTT